MTIDTRQMETRIGAWIVANSGLDQHRTYLGISKIASCPRHAVKEYLYGIPAADEQTYRMCFAGYEQELSIRKMLIETNMMVEASLYKEIVAPFDNRLKGHIDGLTPWEDLIEIKSVSAKKFAKVIETGRSIYDHFIQIQLYMRYGGMRQAFIFYRNRETYEHKVIRVPYKPEQAEKFEAKAKMILSFIDREELPACECGHCL
jgi:hypothetical protein